MKYEVHSITRNMNSQPVAVIERTDLSQPLYKVLTAKQVVEGVRTHMNDLSLTISGAMVNHNYDLRDGVTTFGHTA